MKKKGIEKKLKKVAISVIFAVLLVGLSFAVYMTFFFTQRCESFECFSEKLSECEQGYTYLNDDRQASWLYEIKGASRDGRECIINVELLQAKEGELNLRDIEGLDMDCYYGKGMVVYPEKDITKCHGKLKEGIQDLIIKKLHTYLLENLEDIGKGIRGY